MCRRVDKKRKRLVSPYSMAISILADLHYNNVALMDFHQTYRDYILCQLLTEKHGIPNYLDLVVGISTPPRVFSIRYEDR